MESLCDPSMGKIWYNFFHFSRLPMYLVSRLPGVYSDAILAVTLLHCRFVFGESLPQSPSCFIDVHMIAGSTGYFVNDTLREVREVFFRMRELKPFC